MLADGRGWGGGLEGPGFCDRVEEQDDLMAGGYSILFWLPSSCPGCRITGSRALSTPQPCHLLRAGTALKSNQAGRDFYAVCS